jgi:SOS-response transcriptional repressor LexA
LRAIRQSILTRGITPTLTELAGMMGVRNTNTVRHYLDELERGGWIRRERRVARGISIARRTR